LHVLIGIDGREWNTVKERGISTISQTRLDEIWFIKELQLSASGMWTVFLWLSLITNPVQTKSIDHIKDEAQAAEYASSTGTLSYIKVTTAPSFQPSIVTSPIYVLFLSVYLWHNHAAVKPFLPRKAPILDSMAQFPKSFHSHNTCYHVDVLIILILPLSLSPSQASSSACIPYPGL
jgi:hypothetical protein